MRTAIFVLIAYLLAVVTASLLRFWPTGASMGLGPDVLALTAAYLGLTARSRLAPAIAGAAVAGYLGDIISGTPPGLLALTTAVTALVAHTVHLRLLVRGVVMTLFFSTIIGATSCLAVLMVRHLFGMPSVDSTFAVTRVVACSIATGVLGPPLFAVYRRIDMWFLRGGRDLERLTP